MVYLSKPIRGFVEVKEYSEEDVERMARRVYEEHQKLRDLCMAQKSISNDIERLEGIRTRLVMDIQQMIFYKK